MTVELLPNYTRPARQRWESIPAEPAPALIDPNSKLFGSQLARHQYSSGSKRLGPFSI
jgi:hypothetical protein